MPPHLPGHDLIEQGLRDLGLGQETVESLLVSIGAPRLRDAGVEVPTVSTVDPERRLYDLLSRESTDTAHSRYNALIRILVSFERACASHSQ